ncbi:MAG: recombination mediator protein UvsY [Bacteroidales bacterium]|nr:recombination mediator protein UvsY [Bacteroidales bacterium]
MMVPTTSTEFDTLFDKYNSFVKFEVNQIDQRLTDLPSVVSYYQSMFYTLKSKHTKNQHELDSKWQEKYMYYKTDYNISLTNAEIKSFIEKDLEYLEIKFRLRKITDVLEQVELVLKGLDNMRWTIHDLISWEKFKQGEF